MKKMILSLLAFVCLSASMAQHTTFIDMPLAKFTTGDDPAWSNPSFNDASWKEIKTSQVWQSQGFNSYHGYAWYRIHVVIPSSLKESGFWKDSLRIFLANVNDVDETSLNGVKIGKIGAFPSDPEGYVSKWPFVREYHLPINHPAIKWDKENIISIKVYDGGGSGGIFMGKPYIDMLERTDGLNIMPASDKIKYLAGGRAEVPVVMQNKFNTTTTGVLKYKVFDASTQHYMIDKQEQIKLGPLQTKELKINVPDKDGITFSFVFTEDKTAFDVTGKLSIPYILTPASPKTPKINSAKVFGVRPNAPFLFKVAATGQKPVKYTATGLPKGLAIDSKTGVISGTAPDRGDYTVQVVVTNALGKATQQFTIKAGDLLALTPQMGWNSWNCWGLSVSDERVRSSAQALLDKGLADHGWTYMNIDDGWEAAKRNSDGTISANEKFPDMKKLGDWLHSNGLKFGIYSSPGPTTCGGYLGSFEHEMQDATTYASWGIDYLKYDLCSYSDNLRKDTSKDAPIKPYRIMQKALRVQPRDIFYSLCQYGGNNVGQWGPEVDAQSWRTTGDITDTWQSLNNIGFSQDRWAQFAKPGRWNDPDMMIVGQVGWGENLHPSRLTPDEQYTHVSLWSLLSAPLLIGCDISKLDVFTLNLLTNDEVLAIDQDILGKQGRQIIKNDKYQVWVKELEDGTKAVGIFNMDTTYRTIEIKWKDADVKENATVRDLWRQKDLGVFNEKFSALIPPHGVKLLKIR